MALIFVGNKLQLIENWSATGKACHCEEQSDVAIRNILRCSASRGFSSRKRTDSHASVRTGSE